MARMVRSSVIQVMASDYIQMAILKGVPYWKMVFKHVLPNALLPAINVVALTIAWLLGVPMDDMVVVGQMLGEKTIINEFVAYAELDNIRKAGMSLSPKSLIIATYALCGFANFASIGIQIGGIGAIAPGQRRTLTELGLLALLGGTIASFLTAAIAGVLV